MPSVYMQAILWKSGQIYDANYIFANLNDCRFDFQTYYFISLEFVKCCIWNLISWKQPE